MASRLLQGREDLLLHRGFRLLRNGPAAGLQPLETGLDHVGEEVPADRGERADR
ncbi:hypothetical protein [Streptosporangium sp. 'caverna']|uniref:hypothetical protein n=1 Tax=Streptosporangium sp. 'caverna' TaxID=2202249 RepID=UPI0013A70409|nr:hypothetical protein [Streptosporangium sp. 'caverna']